MSGELRSHKKEKEIIFLEIPGNPVPKKRARFSKYGTYDEQSKVKRRIKNEILFQMSKKSILRRIESHISVEMIFHTPIPKKTSQKRRKELLDAPNPKKPDLDNLIKMYCDCMNKIVYDDDALITELICKKIYSENPRTEIKIRK
jgi:Holliday junction resolvase RusA-like endonuclease